MTLKELKKMVSEEYTKYLKEQADLDMMSDPMGGGAMPPKPGGGGYKKAPGIDVGPDDIDISGEKENPEETLRAIFDMLKDFFEGDDKPKAPSAPKADKGGDKKDDKGGDKGGDKKDDGNKDKEEDKEDDKEKEALQERFQKLANIIK